MSTPSILLVGLSHAVSVRNAQSLRLSRGTATFSLFDLELFPKYNPIVRFEEGKRILNPELEPDLRRVIEARQPRFIIGSFWSNQHFFMSAANMPRRIDFVLPSAPELALDPLAELIPYDVVYNHLRLHCQVQEAMTAAIQGLTGAELLLMPAPLPVEDFAAIPKGSSSKQIDDMVAEHGAAPAALRLKFWRLVEIIHGEMAAAAGISTLPVPPETVDVTGFRRREYYSTDWIHGNSLYGELVLKQFDALLAPR